MINKKPYIDLGKNKAFACFEGWQEIVHQIKQKIISIDKKKIVIAVDCYQGTYADMNLKALQELLSPNVTCRAKDIYKDEREIREIGKRSFKDDAFNANYSTSTIDEYFDTQRLQALRNNIDFIDEGVILMHGIGASKICDSDIIIYSDMSRWEILQRFRRNEISNIGISNNLDPYQIQHKWSHFIDWKICDRIKKKLLHRADFFLDTNNWEKPKMISGELMRKGLDQACSEPLFIAPFFDPELWDESEVKSTTSPEDFSWVFKCNVDEDNVLLKINNQLFETPAINVLFFDPVKFVGESNYKRFGSNLPIRFDFIDCLEGEAMEICMYPGPQLMSNGTNLKTEHNEFFYFMSVNKNAQMSIGLSNNISIEYFLEVLKNSTTISKKRSVSKMLNSYRLNKHDSLTIPPETIFKPALNAMMLNISSSPSIFKWNLFELNQDTLDSVGHIFDASNSFNKFDEDQINKYAENAPTDTTLNSTPNEIIQIERIWFDKKITLELNDSAQIFNLIEGFEVMVSTPGGAFHSKQMHYTETIIAPAGINKIEFAPSEKGVKYGLLKASIRK